VFLVQKMDFQFNLVQIISWLQLHTEHEENYEACEPLAWQVFYRLAPHQVANGIPDAFIHLFSHREGDHSDTRGRYKLNESQVYGTSLANSTTH